MKPTLEQIKTDESAWPYGATHYISSEFTKWVDGAEYTWGEKGWSRDIYTMSLSDYKKAHAFIIVRPTKTFVPEVGEWCESSGGAHVFYVGIDDEGGHVFSLENGGLTKYHSISDFRPIKSERELFVEKVRELHKAHQWTVSELAEELYDSGLFCLKEPTK